MKQEHALAVKRAIELVERGEVVSAERALVEISEADGDKALALILEEGHVPSSTLLSILELCEAHNPSVINLLISPKKFGELVETAGKYGIDSFDLATSTIFRDNADPVEFISYAVSTAEGVESLGNMLLARSDLGSLGHFVKFGTFDVHSQEPDDDQLSNADHSWKQVAQILAIHFPVSWAEICVRVRKSLALAIEEEAEEAAERARREALEVPDDDETPGATSQQAEESAL